VARGLLYAAAGADCVYPILVPPAHLAELAERIGRPLNAICVPGGPTPRELGASGATRITYGGGLQKLALDAVRDLAKGLLA
jgi:2-methylisocitrate lyase-like PEP mutase family enzyme